MLKTERTATIWPTVHLGTLFKLSSGSTKPDDLADEQCVERPYPVYGGNGVMGYSAQANVNGRNIVIGRVGANCGCVHLADGKAWITDNALYTASKLVEYDDAFLSELLSHLRLDRLRGQSGQPLVTQEPIHSLKTLLPPLPEQRKIAEILRTWDEAIAKLEALRAAKRDNLTGITQQLIGRGGAFPQKWPLKPLSSIAARVRRQNGGGDHPVMTISAKSGFLMQSDKFARDMAGSSVERYTLLEEGEFAYNKGNSLTAPYGCVYRLDRPAALVPFVYFCFALKAGLDHGFYEHLFAAGALNHQLSRLINSGVRNDGLLNLNVEDFFPCRVPVPPLDEQSSIARTLSAAKQELTLLDDEIEALTRQKRGLMQKLLTGEWRVKVEGSGA